MYVANEQDRRLLQQLLDGSPRVPSLPATLQPSSTRVTIPCRIVGDDEDDGGVRGEIWGIASHAVNPRDTSDFGGSLNDTEEAKALEFLLKNYRDYPLFRLEQIDEWKHPYQNGFVILDEDVPYEQTVDGVIRYGRGRGVIAGAVWTKVRIRSNTHRTACLARNTGEITPKAYLDSAAHGPIKVLSRASGNVDEIVDAFVLLGDQTPSSMIVRVLSTGDAQFPDDPPGAGWYWVAPVRSTIPAQASLGLTYAPNFLAYWTDEGAGSSLVVGKFYNAFRVGASDDWLLGLRKCTDVA